jgi:hypothetical protein
MRDRTRPEHRPADRRRQEEQEEARYSTDHSLSAPGEAEALRDVIRNVIDNYMDDGWLPDATVRRLYEVLGIPAPPTLRPAGSYKEAAAALEAENAELRRHLDDMARKWREAVRGRRELTEIVKRALANGDDCALTYGDADDGEPGFWINAEDYDDLRTALADGEATAEGSDG